MHMSVLVGKDSKVVIQGITGREASMVTEHCIAYGTRISAGVTPGKGGQSVSGVPVYDTMREACQYHELNTSVVYVPPAAVYDAALEAIDNGLRLVVIVTERVPCHDVGKILHRAREESCTVVGPNSVGIINPRDRTKLGPIGGDKPERCFVPGGVGVVSRSGGMTAECAWMARRAGYGVSTCVSVGGDPILGCTPTEALALFEGDEATDAVILWGEPGTTYEEEVAELINAGAYSKPLIAFVAGRFTERYPRGTVFGHAASIIRQGQGEPSSKIAALREAGAYVAETFDDVTDLVLRVMPAQDTSA
jgi:succinyl-CoA synthetase alpha subunit